MGFANEILILIKRIVWQEKNSIFICDQDLN